MLMEKSPRVKQELFPQLGYNRDVSGTMRNVRVKLLKCVANAASLSHSLSHTHTHTLSLSEHRQTRCQICKSTIRISGPKLCFYSVLRDGIYMCGAVHTWRKCLSQLSVHIRARSSFPRNLSTRTHICVFYSWNTWPVYRIGVIRSGNCMYDVPPA